MAEVLLFHHAQGLTAGVRSFADELRAAGHVVHTPDLYDGQTFPTIDDGVKHAKSVGFGTILDRGVAASEGLPDHLVYAGFSLGVMPAQKLAQTRRGAKGALRDFNCYPQVIDFAAALQQRGYSEADVHKILGGNFLRVFEQVWK